MMEVSVEEVEQAVVQFFTDPLEKTDLNSWLTYVQHSQDAWKFAWVLLDKSKPEEVQFFAGNTIYIKVSRYWHEVPKEEYESLKVRLLLLIAQFSDRKAVLTRLLKALGAYVIHTIEAEWTTALEDLINMFNPEVVIAIEPTTALDLLFNILMFIPDELDRCQDTMGVRTSNKQSIEAMLKSNSKRVLSLSLQVMQSNQVSNVTKELVLKALNAWLHLSLPLTDARDVLVALIPYSNFGILCEPVIECIRTAITDRSSYNVPNTVMEFITQLLLLKPVLDEALQCEDETTSAMIYSLFTAIVESHSRLLLQSALEDTHRNTVIQVVTMLVNCSATPGQYPTQETLSNIPFAVWYTIQDDILAFEGEQKCSLLSLFKPVYLKLVDTFIQKSLLPFDSPFSAEEKELFRCYRQDICDTYMYAYLVLKGDMLDKLEGHLKDGVARIQNNPSDWQYLEAVLHAYSSIAETVADLDNVYVPRFIQSIPQIPFSDNVQLISVALTTLGAYADWLNFHHDHLHHVIPLMVAGLMNSSLVSAASQALRDLTLECPLTIAPFCQPILQSCQKALEQSPKIYSAETERIVTIISRVLSVGLDQNDVMLYLNAMLPPYVNRISQLKDVMEKYPSEDDKMELISLLKLLGCLSRHLNLNHAAYEECDEDVNTQIIVPKSHCEPQPLMLVLQPLMPILLKLASSCASEPAIVEALCKLLKNSISTLMDDSILILPAVLEILPQLYEASSSSAVLDVMKQLMLMFGKDPKQEQNMALLLQIIVTTTLSRASTDLWSHTESVQGCLSLLSASLKKAPRLLMNLQLPQLYAFGMEALKLPEEATIKSAASFLTSFLVFTHEPSGSHCRPMVSQSMEPLVRTILSCICNCPRHSLIPFSEILSTLVKLYGDDLNRAFKTVQVEENLPSPKVTNQHKEEFAKKVMRNRGSRRRIMEAITDLALVSRGLAGTEYGMQTRGYH